MNELSEAILNNDKKLMINLSKEISNLSNSLSKSLKSETDKIGKSIEESNIVALTKVNKEVNKMIEKSKKNNNAKLLKELSNSTTLTQNLDAISSQINFCEGNKRQERAYLLNFMKLLMENKSNFLIKLRQSEKLIWWKKFSEIR